MEGFVIDKKVLNITDNKVNNFVYTHISNNMCKPRAFIYRISYKIFLHNLATILHPFYLLQRIYFNEKHLPSFKWNKYKLIAVSILAHYDTKVIKLKYQLILRCISKRSRIYALSC